MTPIRNAAAAAGVGLLREALGRATHAAPAQASHLPPPPPVDLPPLALEAARSVSWSARAAPSPSKRLVGLALLCDRR
jgi:hypothetical protein